MADLVAWSAIRLGEPNNNPQNAASGETKVIKPGETVTQESLGLNDEQFRQLVESGAVRPLEYPDMPETYQDSPVNYLREQARIASEGALSNAQNSEENINAILAANAASTGALQGEELDPEVRAEMERQKEDQSSEASPPAPTTTQVNPDQ